MIKVAARSPSEIPRSPPKFCVLSLKKISLAYFSRQKKKKKTFPLFYSRLSLIYMATYHFHGILCFFF